MNHIIRTILLLVLGAGWTSDAGASLAMAEASAGPVTLLLPHGLSGVEGVRIKSEIAYKQPWDLAPGVSGFKEAVFVVQLGESGPPIEPADSPQPPSSSE